MCINATARRIKAGRIYPTLADWTVATDSIRTFINERRLRVCAITGSTSKCAGLARRRTDLLGYGFTPGDVSSAIAFQPQFPFFLLKLRMAVPATF